MPQSLHPNANLEVLKKQAKKLLKAHRLADGSRESRARTAYTCQTLRSLHRFADKSDAEILAVEIKLTDAQYAIALQYGFESWKKLKQHVEESSRQDAQQDSREDAADPVELVQLVEVSKLTSGLLCTSNRDVYVVDPQTGQKMNLTRGRVIEPWEAAASPDGMTVAVRSNAWPSLFLIDMDTLALQESPPCFEYSSHLSWCPDSSKVAHGNINGIIDVPEAERTDLLRQAVVLDRETLGAEAVAQNEYHWTPGKPQTELMFPAPVWSPDGERIALNWKKDAIAIVSPDGSGKREIPVPGMDVSYDHNVGESLFVWNPAADKLAVAVGGRWSIRSLDGRVVQEDAPDRLIESWLEETWECRHSRSQDQCPPAAYRKVESRGQFQGRFLEVTDDSGITVFNVEKSGGMGPWWF